MCRAARAAEVSGPEAVERQRDVRTGHERSSPARMKPPTWILSEDLFGVGDRFAVVDAQSQIGLRNRAEEAKCGGTHPRGEADKRDVAHVGENVGLVASASELMQGENPQAVKHRFEGDAEQERPEHISLADALRAEEHSCPP